MEVATGQFSKDTRSFDSFRPNLKTVLSVYPAHRLCDYALKFAIETNIENLTVYSSLSTGGSVTQAQKGLGSNRSRDAVG